MIEPNPYKTKTVMKMMVAAIIFITFFNSAEIYNWMQRLSADSAIKPVLVSSFEPVYALCDRLPYINFSQKLKQDYRRFAGIDYREKYDVNPSIFLSMEKYSWLKPSEKQELSPESKLAELESVTPPAIESFDTNTVLKVLLIGDSMLKVGFGDILSAKLKAKGKIEVTYFGKNSTGLSRQDYFDWFAKLESLCKGIKYHLIVLMIGANDAQGFNKDGKVFNYGTPEWIDSYRSKTNLFAAMMSKYSHRFYWIGMPPMLMSKFDAKMKTLSKIYAEETVKFPNGSYIATTSILGDNKGGYTAYGTVKGKKVLLRGNDGIHFANGGGELLTDAVLEKFKKDFKR
ncbi:MAG: DUF459 domain-containing protein [Ignavibacteriales bacterium]|nr:DUF459 domain-containing protein [Ignavibacteriales bacterium]